MIRKMNVYTLTDFSHYGDWLVLRRMGQNMDMFVFNQFIRKLLDDAPTSQDFP